MIFARYEIVPGRKHPDFGSIGLSWANCWLRVRSFDAAREIASRMIRGAGWSSLSLEEIWRVPPGHYRKRDAGFEYFEQAKTDRTVFVFFTSPLHPVYCVEFVAVATRTNRCKYPAGTKAAVKYWVVNEEVSKTADCLDDFWGKATHQSRAVNLGRKRIEAEGWRVTAVKAKYGINYLTHRRNKLLTKYYEEAEDLGDCLAFWIE